MNRPHTTKWLSELLEQYIDPYNDPRIYWAKEVTFDYASLNAVRVDYMRFKPVNNSVSGIEKGDVYCYEVKSSVADYHSRNGHNAIGDYNYYVMPQEVYEAVKQSLPFAVGVLCPEQVGKNNDVWQLKVVRKARRKDRTKPLTEMLLMLWRSSRREVVKCKRKEMPD